MATTRRRINGLTFNRRNFLFGSAAVATAAPLVALGGNAAYRLVDSNPSGPRAATVDTTPLIAGITKAVNDAAIAMAELSSSDNPQRGLIKELRRDTEFSQFALTWPGFADVTAYFRALRPDGSWSEWYHAETHNSSPDDGGEGNGLSGTELIYLEPTTAVQVSVTGLNIFGDIKEIAKELAEGSGDAPAFGSSDADKPAGDKATLPGSVGAISWADIEPISDDHPFHQANAVFIDGGVDEGINPAVDATNLTGMPRVITRAGWGADPSLSRTPTYNDSVRGITVHHTAGSNNYTEAQAPGIVRGILHYHAVTRGWKDIGYNALVDKFGNIYEGRTGGLDKNVQGAHAGGFNVDTWGISMMGDYSSINPTEATLKSVANMIGWRLAVAGLDPMGSVTLTSSGGSDKYSRGTAVDLPVVFAHRDVGTTTCPGDAGYAQMERIRLLTKRKYDEVKGGIINNEGPEGGSGLEIGDQPVDIGSLPLPGSMPSGSDAGEKAREIIEGLRSGAAGDPSVNADGAPAAAPAEQPMDRVHVHAGNQSMLAGALGVQGSPALGGTADDVFGVVRPVRDAEPTIADIAVAPGPVLDRDADNAFAAAWRDIIAKHGDVLGEALSPIQVGASVPGADGTPRAVRFVKFAEGVLSDTSDGQVAAIWGPIADAWAAQGFETGALGEPTGTQVRDGAGWRAEFRGGTIIEDRRGGTTVRK